LVAVLFDTRGKVKIFFYGVYQLSDVVGHLLNTPSHFFIIFKVFT
jgi:hypothetical protein